MNVNEIFDRYLGGERNFEEVDLRGANLSEAQLMWIDLMNADLMWANLMRADLTGANLKNANLVYANLTGADLSNAELSTAQLNATILNEASMIRVDLRGANLRGAILVGANLKFADLRGADLSGANLSRANLRNAKLKEAILWTANLSEANLSLADLSDADLSCSCLYGANLADAKLVGCKLTDAKLNGANIKGTILDLDLYQEKYPSRYDADNSRGFSNKRSREVNYSSSQISQNPLPYQEPRNTSSFAQHPTSYSPLGSPAPSFAQHTPARMPLPPPPPTVKNLDWTLPLRSLQSDFIHRVRSGNLLLSETEGQHSELMLIKGDRLNKIRDFCWKLTEQSCQRMINQREQFSRIRDIFLKNMQRQLAIEVVKDRLPDLLIETDYQDLLLQQESFNFSFDTLTNFKITPLLRFGNINTVKWTISQEQIQQYEVIIFIYSQEEVTEAQTEYHLIFAGFIPSELIPSTSGRTILGIDKLLYGGGLRSYLESFM